MIPQHAIHEVRGSNPCDIFYHIGNPIGIVQKQHHNGSDGHVVHHWCKVLGEVNTGNLVVSLCDQSSAIHANRLSLQEYLLQLGFRPDDYNCVVSLWSLRKYKLVMYSSALKIIMIILHLVVPFIGGKNPLTSVLMSVKNSYLQIVVYLL